MPPAFILSQDQTLHLICSLCFRFRVSYCSKLTFFLFSFQRSNVFFRLAALSSDLDYYIIFSTLMSSTFFTFFKNLFWYLLLRFALAWRSFIIPKHSPFVNTFFRLFLSFFYLFYCKRFHFMISFSHSLYIFLFTYFFLMIFSNI